MSHQLQLQHLDIHPIVCQHKSLLEGLGVGGQVFEFCTDFTGYKTVETIKTLTIRICILYLHTVRNNMQIILLLSNQA